VEDVDHCGVHREGCGCVHEGSLGVGLSSTVTISALDGHSMVSRLSQSFIIIIDMEQQDRKRETGSAFRSENLICCMGQRDTKT
jgi:hypothetical protein